MVAKFLHFIEGDKMKDQETDKYKSWNSNNCLYNPEEDRRKKNRGIRSHTKKANNRK